MLDKYDYMRPCTHAHKHARAHMHSPTHAHTKICNSYCFSTTTVVSETRLCYVIYTSLIVCVCVFILQRKVRAYFCLLTVRHFVLSTTAPTKHFCSHKINVSCVHINYIHPPPPHLRVVLSKRLYNWIITLQYFLEHFSI
jgi:hypothetical protein